MSVFRAFVLLLALAATTPLLAQGTRRLAPSGRAMTEVLLTVPGGPGAAPDTTPPAVIRVEYGQPHLRGRVLHTDSLVPWDRPWRTGANAATTLRTDVDLLLGDAAIPRGTYVLFTLPGREGWQLIVQRSAGQGGEFDPAHDVARVPLAVRTLAEPLESLSFWLIPGRDPGTPRGELRLAWGRVELSTRWSVR